MWDAELRMQLDVFLYNKKKKRNEKWEVSDSHNILHNFNHINTETGMTLDGRIRKVGLVYMCRNINKEKFTVTAETTGRYFKALGCK